MRKIIYQLVFMAIVFQTQAQSITKSLDQYMAQVKGGSYDPIPSKILNTKDVASLLTELNQYQQDTIPKIRAKAYAIAKSVGQQSNQASIRSQAVSVLTQGLQDKDSGIIDAVMEGLSGFLLEDFAARDKERIGQYIDTAAIHLDMALKLAGWLQLTQFRIPIDQIIQSDASFTDKWAARLALCRMGDQASTGYLLLKLSRAPIDDDFVYDFVPGLVYTRNPEIFAYLETIIQSDQANCMSADPDSSQKILCGYRVMEYIAPVIVDFPLPVDEFGELMVADYEQALQEVRVWLDQHETYEIQKEGF
ncbi:hypothetical protein N6H18_05910 [Reichenbachiella agarivorans]|uniref:HEAT repeat-containing protein n=1 Tax=Reichenbachiella agarivorans TaxID=2979464 RepID=A0ABY6CSI8_9BACT|nr:hypothetical protein [Reichenbachiella agarivorans]UXP33486.1 hypothetical protein N6H18_05910 [Reichenbachiella agarivorans]